VDLHVTHYDGQVDRRDFPDAHSDEHGLRVPGPERGCHQECGQGSVFNVRPLQTRDASWEVGLQWGRNNNRVVSLAGAQFRIPAGGFEGSSAAAVTGSRVGVIYGTDFIPLRPGDHRPDRRQHRRAVRRERAQGRGVFSRPTGTRAPTSPTAVIGDPTPDWTGACGRSFQYKKWQISGLLDVSQRWAEVERDEGCALSVRHPQRHGNPRADAHLRRGLTTTSSSSPALGRVRRC